MNKTAFKKIKKRGTKRGKQIYFFKVMKSLILAGFNPGFNPKSPREGYESI